MKYIWGYSTSRPDIFSLFLPSRQMSSIFQNLHSRSVLFCNFVIVDSRYSVLECCHQYGLWCSQFPTCSPHSLTYGQKKTWISHVLVNMSVTCPYSSTKLKYDPEDENIDLQRKLKQGQIWIQFCDDHKANCQEIHKTCALKLKPLQGNHKIQLFLCFNLNMSLALYIHFRGFLQKTNLFQLLTTCSWK